MSDPSWLRIQDKEGIRVEVVKKLGEYGVRMTYYYHDGSWNPGNTKLFSPFELKELLKNE